MSDRRTNTEKRIERCLNEFDDVSWCCVQNMKTILIEWINNDEAAESTWFHRLSDLLRFKAWCDKQKNVIRRPDKEDFKRYMNDMKGRGIRASSIRACYIRIRAFFRWMDENDRYPDITKGTKIDKAVYREKTILTASEAKHLIDSQTKIKYKAMICLMLYCGLRCIEIAELKWSDISGDRALIRGKGRKDKSESIVLPITVQCVLNDLRNESEGEYVFMSDFYREKQPMTALSVSHALNEILNDHFKDKHVSAHSLRHTAITLALESGMDITRVSRFARHRSINTTMVYIHDNNRYSDPAECKIEAMIEHADSEATMSDEAFESALKRALLKIMKDQS